MGIFAFAACTADEVPLTSESANSVRMRLCATVQPFDDAAPTRAGSEWTWEDGAVLYLQFHNGDNLVRGYAVYSASDDSWEVPSWAGTLASAGQCELFYFDGASAADKKAVTLQTSQAVYVDRQGSYSLNTSGGVTEVTVEGSLAPATSRVRFAGAAGLKVTVSGLKYYIAYNAEENVLSQSIAAITLTVGSDGYTPYVYCLLKDETTRELTITNSVDGSDIRFKRSFPATAFVAGQSGYITAPTEDTNRGWTVIAPPFINLSATSVSMEASASTKTVSVESNVSYTASSSANWLETSVSSDRKKLTLKASENTFTTARTATVTLSGEELTKKITVTQAGYAPDLTFIVSGVTFKMIWVKAGTFQMGKAGSEDVATPVHQVTLTKDYYMGETEVTNALWKAVMGSVPSKKNTGDSYPVENINYEDCQSFLTKLNQLTGQTFRFPTEAEWEFAAKGGTQSKGYTYAGSNTIDDVAWYTNNSSSTTHPVAQKKANELGLYDMSGNVWEWCLDWSDSYSSSAQTDPTGAASGSYRVLRGGSWYNVATYCRVAYRGADTPAIRDRSNGFRLAL